MDVTSTPRDAKGDEISHRVAHNANLSTLAISPVQTSSHQVNSTPSSDRVRNSTLQRNSLRQKNESLCPPSGSLVDRLRLWRHDALMQHQYVTAEFIGDKILSLTSDPKDAFWLAQVYFSSGHYARARELLTKQELDFSVSCRYLIALCLVKMEDWDKALEILGEKNPFQDVNETAQPDGGIKLESSMCYLRGLVFANLNNFDRAKQCYKEAVKIDPKCYEAYDQLIRNNLLTPQEERHFVASLDFEISLPGHTDLLKALYFMRLSKPSNSDLYKDAQALLVTDLQLGDNSDLLLCKADMLYTQCKYQKCLEICERILEADKYKYSALPVYLACLYELDERNRLFSVAHDLADEHADEPVSWLAVGTYYLVNEKVAEARRYFSKATMMDPCFGQAWIGFAHTFAIEGEHEQAISAYATASRLFQGTHVPTLFLGMQHLHLGNLALAEEYLTTSYSVCHVDPLLLNELGVLRFHQQKLDEAAQFLRKARELFLAAQSEPSAWMSIEANLGHVYRRLGSHDLALVHFDHVLRLTPANAGIHTAKGLVHLAAQRRLEAIDCLHNALSASPGDQVATDLLNRAMKELAELDSRDQMALYGVFDDIDELKKFTNSDTMDFD